MKNESWIKRGKTFDNGSKVAKVISEGEHWQIIKTTYDNYVLICVNSIIDKWVEMGLINDSLFRKMDGLSMFFSMNGYLISSLLKGPYPDDVTQIQVFSCALQEARKMLPYESLADAVFIEELSKILPTFELNTKKPDDVVMGSWITGGVDVSVTNSERFVALTKWADEYEVNKAIADAGFKIKLHNNRKDADAIKKTIRDGNFELPGRGYLQNFFNENIVNIIQKEDQYKKMGIGFPSATILHGPTGCGKTYAVDKLVEFLDWPCYRIDSSSIGSPYIHDTSKKISEIFDLAIENAPSIIVIDEMDAFLTDRNEGSLSGIHHVEEVSEFLRRIPEATSNRVLVIGMTNMIEKIDTAIARRGRFDHIIEVEMPSKMEVKSALLFILDNIPYAEDLDLDNISDKLAGHPMSDIAFVVREAGRLAVQDNKDCINSNMIDKAIDLLPKAKNDRRIGF